VGAQAIGAVEGDPYKSGAKLLARQLPFQNLFYTKALYNKFIADQIIEMADPGYIIDKQRRDLRERDQEWWIYD
jgi:hypothetical protein